MQNPGVTENAYVLVEYEFEYTAKDGKIISIKPNERYLLLKKTNDHWWHVRRDEPSKPFYIPAKYVKELSPGILPSNGLMSYSEPNELHCADFVDDASVVDSQQYMYTFVSDKNDTPCNTYIQKSILHQSHLSQQESGSNLSIPDIFVPDIVCKSSREDLLPQIGEERCSSNNSLTPLRTFGSFLRLHIRKTMYGPEFNAPSSIRSSQSLDNLARLTPERKAGDRRSEVVAGARVYLQAQDNHKVQHLSNEAIPAGFLEVPQRSEVPGAPDSRHVSEGSNSHLQVSQENNLSPVYVNVAELRQKAAKAGSSSRLQSTSSTVDEWETRIDQDSRKLFYYNSLSGETTWESPFYQQDDPANSPNSVISEASPIDSEWERYFDEPTGRFFFYNSSTGETSWQPPEQEELSPHEMKPMYYQFPTMDQRPPTPETDYPEYSPKYDAFPAEDYSPQETHHNFFFPFFHPERSPLAYDIGSPPGWSCETNKDGKKVYTHITTHEMWIMSQDDQGRTFFHTADGSESQWTLPQRLLSLSSPRASIHSDTDGISFSSWNMNTPAFIIPRSDEGLDAPSRRNALDFTGDHEQGMVLESLHHHPKGLDKAGILNKTKIAEHGKRLRKKNWSSSWTVLEGSILTFYKDGKNQSTSSMKQSSSLNTPEYTVELKGATMCWAPKEKSSKKNVLELKTRGGSEYLVQHDKDSIATDWYNIILDSIQTMSLDTTTEHSHHPQKPSPNERIEGTNKEEKEKDKKAPGMGQKSNDMTMDSTDSNKVRNKLKRFLQRRPTIQSLRDKGYIKDQVFGCHLHVLCEREKTSVPKFVKECIRTVENRGLDIDGLYRISGNLATIQKLRFKADHEENLNLDDGRWEDIHVITGALKLFFRELPEPLFPFSHFDRFISAIKMSDPKAQVEYLKELVQSLPPPNRETMKALFQHLCRVIVRRDANRMSVKSVAIVFGPTLLKKEMETGNIAIHMVFQNQIVEQILSNCNYIFAES